MLASLSLGVSAALAVHHLMSYLRRSESGALPSLSTLEGAQAQVVIGLSGSRPGKISVATGELIHQLLATIHGGAEADGFGAGDTVVIVRVENGVAQVAEATFIA